MCPDEWRPYWNVALERKPMRCNTRPARRHESAGGPFFFPWVTERWDARGAVNASPSG